jgi:hypothetical protein
LTPRTPSQDGRPQRRSFWVWLILSSYPHDRFCARKCGAAATMLPAGHSPPTFNLVKRSVFRAPLFGHTPP